MTKYYIESADKSVTYFKAFDMCNEAHKEGRRLAKELNIKFNGYRSFYDLIDNPREKEFLWCEFFPDGKTKFTENGWDELLKRISDPTGY